MNFRHLETVSRVAPFGTRFIDTVLKMPITDGLRVTAYPTAFPQRRQTLSSNGSGTFFLHSGPGLGGFAFGDGDDAYWSAIPDANKVSYTFEVVDTLGRFISHRLTVKLPHRKLYTPTCLRSPAESNPPFGVPLYSTAARLLPAGMAVIRAQLWNRTDARPAAFVLVEAIEGSFTGEVFTARAGAKTYRGISDANGALALIMPVPQPYIDKPLNERLKWQLRLIAFGQAPGTVLPPIPDLCDLLSQNRPATLLSAEPNTALGLVTLELGHELILKTSSPAVPSSWLHLVPN